MYIPSTMFCLDHRNYWNSTWMLWEENHRHPYFCRSLCSNNISVSTLQHKDVNTENNLTRLYGYKVTLDNYKDTFCHFQKREDDRYNTFYNFVFDLYVVWLLVFWRNVLNVSTFISNVNQYEIKGANFHFKIILWVSEISAW